LKAFKTQAWTREGRQFPPGEKKGTGTKKRRTVGRGTRQVKRRTPGLRRAFQSRVPLQGMGEQKRLRNRERGPSSHREKEREKKRGYRGEPGVH